MIVGQHQHQRKQPPLPVGRGQQHPGHRARLFMGAQAARPFPAQDVGADPEPPGRGLPPGAAPVVAQQGAGVLHQRHQPVLERAQQILRDRARDEIAARGQLAEEPRGAGRAGRVRLGGRGGEGAGVRLWLRLGRVRRHRLCRAPGQPDLRVRRAGGDRGVRRVRGRRGVRGGGLRIGRRLRRGRVGVCGPVIGDSLRRVRVIRGGRRLCVGRGVDVRRRGCVSAVSATSALPVASGASAPGAVSGASAPGAISGASAPAAISGASAPGALSAASAPVSGRASGPGPGVSAGMSAGAVSSGEGAAAASAASVASSPSLSRLSSTGASDPLTARAGTGNPTARAGRTGCPKRRR